MPPNEADTRVAPKPITPEDRVRMGEENAAHNAEVEAWAKKQRDADIAAGIMPPPLVTSIADSIKKKLEGGDIHEQSEREERERQLAEGGNTA